MDHLRAGLQREIRTCYMRGRANAGRSVVDRAGSCLRQGYKLHKGANAQRRSHVHDRRRLSDQVNAGKPVDRVKWQVLVQRSQYRVGRVGQQNGVAVGRSHSNRLRPDETARARPVRDDDPLIEALRQPFRE